MASAINRFELLPSQKKQIKTIITHIKSRKNLHIYGSEGIGKSVLLDYVYDNWKEIDNSLIPIYCRNSKTLRQMFLYISEFLLDHFKNLKSIDKFKQVKELKHPSDIKKLNIRTLRDIVFSYISQDNFCVILDHLEYVTPKINAFLSSLYEKSVVISASKQSWEITDYNFRGKLDYCLYLIPKLRIENLPKKESLTLIRHLYEKQNIDVTAELQVFEDIFYATKGTPKMIIKIFEKAQRPEYFKGNTLNLNLILIDCQMRNL